MSSSEELPNVMVHTEDEAEDSAPGACPSGSASAAAGCEHPAAGLSERPPPAATKEEMPFSRKASSRHVRPNIRYVVDRLVLDTVSVINCLACSRQACPRH